MQPTGLGSQSIHVIYVKLPCIELLESNVERCRDGVVERMDDDHGGGDGERTAGDNKTARGSRLATIAAI